MKYIYTLLLTIPLLFTSCLKDQDDVFDKSSPERMQEALDNAMEILTNAENGWRMDMFPSKTRDYGGYTLFLDFNKEVVKAASELSDPSYTEESEWELKASSGPVLSFSDNNSLIHFFSGPNKGVGAYDTGLGGDYDFIILEATKDRIKLKGTKTGNINYLTPIGADENWTELMTKYQDAVYKMQWEMLEYQVNDKQYSANVSYNTFIITYAGEDGKIIQEVLPYIFTLDGIRFYEPFNIDGVEVSEMIYKDEGELKYFEDVNGSGARFVVQILPLMQQFLQSSWYFSYSNMGDLGKLYWQNAYTILYGQRGFELYYAYLGIRNGRFGFHANASNYSGSLYYDTEVISEDEVKLKFVWDGDANGIAFYNSYGFNYYIAGLGSSEKNYTIAADNPDKPQYITITDKSNPNNSYTLSKSMVSYPYKN
ncbi:DUF4302 domain-containing protein [Dysgonomonas massiliensis]|uniref:DUF4302 domain-containing protein n=1 Tax=Dysgonomonas massiliensis TaxID=2040292 RepID=UPI000C78B260|nr:DUF4302 domain-containing protein [Dysgonomonas massiliensis]